MIEKPFNRALPAPGKAILDLFGLFCDMNMDSRQIFTAIDNRLQQGLAGGAQ